MEPDEKLFKARKWLEYLSCFDGPGAAAMMTQNGSYRLNSKTDPGAIGQDAVAQRICDLSTLLNPPLTFKEIGTATGSLEVAIRNLGYGITVDGKPYENEYVWWFEFDKKKISKVIEYLDLVYGNEILSG